MQPRKGHSKPKLKRLKLRYKLLLPQAKRETGLAKKKADSEEEETQA